MNILVKAIIGAGVDKLTGGLTGGVKRSIAARMRRVADQAEKAFAASAAGWNPPVDFTSSGDPMSEMIIATNDARFKWVDDGVRPHTIMARNRKRMAFPGTYQAKTTPGRVLRGSGRYGGGMVYARIVRHPGIRARNISKRIAEQTQRNVEREVSEAIRSALG